MTQTLPSLLFPQDRTNSALLTRRAEETGDRPLLLLGASTYSASDIRDRAGETAASLLRAGVSAGDRVAILCGNRIEFLDLYFACAWINAIAVPINFSARGGHRLREQGVTPETWDRESVGYTVRRPGAEAR